MRNEARSFSAIGRDYISVFSYAVAHFSVDFACAFLLFRLYFCGVVTDAQVYFFFLVYNLLAFGTEFIIGLFFQASTARVCATFGCLVLALGLALGGYVEHLSSSISPNLISCYEIGVLNSKLFDVSVLKRLSLLALFSFILAGVGNAYFHVGGGVDSLSRNIGKYWRSGVFLSTGALGIAFGRYYGNDENASFLPAVSLLLLSTCLVWFLCKFPEHRLTTFSLDEEKTSVDQRKRIITEHDPFYLQFKGDALRVVPLFAILGVVWVRSFTGFVVLDFTLDNVGSYFYVNIAIASFLGKYIGGYLADLLGARLVGTFAILTSIPTLCLSSSPSVFLFGLIALNVSTSITLLSTARYFPRRSGCAFGLTTIMLLGGFLVHSLFLRDLNPNDIYFKAILSTILFLSALALLRFVPPNFKSENS